MDNFKPMDLCGRINEKLSILLFPNSPLELVMDESDERDSRFSILEQGSWVGEVKFAGLLESDGTITEKNSNRLLRLVHKDIGWFISSNAELWVVEDLRDSWELWDRIRPENLESAIALFDRGSYGDPVDGTGLPTPNDFKMDLVI